MNGCCDKSESILHEQFSNFPSEIQGMLDSGSSGNFLNEHSPQQNVEKQKMPLKINQPNGEKSVSKHKSELKISPESSKATRAAHAFEKMTFPSVSVAKLCDDGCTVVFDKHKATTVHKGKAIKEAPRDEMSELWTMNLQNLNECTNEQDKEFAMNVTTPEASENGIKKLLLFLHGALGCPTRSTLIKALKLGHLATWPGLTTQRIQKHIQENTMTDKGHMHMTRQIKKLKQEKTEQSQTEEEALNPQQETDNEKTNLNFARIEETGPCGTDQTGKFPVRSKKRQPTCICFT